MRKPSFLLCVKCPRYEWKVIRENRGTHGVSSLMLSTLVLSNEKPLPLCVSIGGGSMSLMHQKPFQHIYVCLLCLLLIVYQREFQQVSFLMYVNIYFYNKRKGHLFLRCPYYFAQNDYDIKWYFYNKSIQIVKSIRSL